VPLKFVATVSNKMVIAGVNSWYYKPTIQKSCDYDSLCLSRSLCPWVYGTQQNMWSYVKTSSYIQ